MSKLTQQNSSLFDRTTAGAILRLFPLLAGKLQEFTPIDQGQANETARIVADDHSYILKRLPLGVDRHRQQYAIIVQKVLTEAGFPCPRLIPDGKDQELIEHCGRTYTLQTWLQGNHLPLQQREAMAPEISRLLGELLGNLHSILGAASLPEAPTSAESSAEHQIASVHSSVESFFAGKPWRPSQYWKLRLRPGKTSFDEAVLQLLPKLRRSTRHLHQWFAMGHEILLPMSPTHGDINFENILFGQDQQVALLDFDNVKVQPTACELSAAVAILCPDCGPARQEFLAAYESTGHKLPDTETLRHLMLLKYCRSLAWQIPAWYNQGQEQPEIRDWIIFLGKRLVETWGDISSEGKEL